MKEELADESLSSMGPLVFEIKEELALPCLVIRGLKPACIMSFIDLLCMPPKPIGLKHLDSATFSTRTVCLPVSICDKLALASLFFLCCARET